MQEELFTSAQLRNFFRFIYIPAMDNNIQNALNELGFELITVDYITRLRNFVAATQQFETSWAQLLEEFPYLPKGNEGESVEEKILSELGR